VARYCMRRSSPTRATRRDNRLTPRSLGPTWFFHFIVHNITYSSGEGIVTKVAGNTD
jgi:hypothetical protein